MPHYAHINENNIVTNVIVAEESFIHSGLVGDPRNWIKTSFHTRGNWHPDNKPLRKNYAGVGYTYNKELDAFIAPKPAPEAVLNTETGLWE